MKATGEREDFISCDSFCICFEFSSSLEKFNKLMSELESFFKKESLDYEFGTLKGSVFEGLNVSPELFEEVRKNYKKSLRSIQSIFSDSGIDYSLRVRSTPDFGTLILPFKEKLEKLTEKNKAKADRDIRKLRKHLKDLRIIRAKGEKFGINVIIESTSLIERPIRETSSEKVILFQNILGKYATKIERCNACGSFVFNIKDFKFIGGLILPRDISLKVDRESKVGAVKLTGLTLEFEKSSLGINRISFDIKDKEGNISIGTQYKATDLDNLNKKAYEHLTEIAKIFVEEI